MRTIIISKLHITVALFAVILGITSARVAASDVHHYTVTVDASLNRLDIRADFSAPVRDIAARSRSAARFLMDARDCDSGNALTNRNHRLVIPATGTKCVQYSVDLAAAASSEHRNSRLDSNNIIVSPTLWMWRPRLGGNDAIDVSFTLPEDIRVSVPWQPLESPHTYRLTASPQSGYGIAIFGQFESGTTEVAGETIRVDLLRAQRVVELAPTIDWVREAAYNITLAYGRFPNPAARVVVFPMTSSPWPSASPVYFGRVVRDGGETVELLIDPERPATDFYSDWTATHELSHMMLPYVRREQRWLSEGFAQYYQNLLLARAGRYSEREAWQRLYDGFERGRASVPGLSPNQAAGGSERNTRMKIYWSGAALALLADVELRRRSQGEESLDTLLDQLQRCCLPAQGSWSGRRLVATLDSFLDEPLLVALYDRLADTAGFPDVWPLLQHLGVVVEDGKVQLRDDAELAEIRAALTAQRYTRSPGD